MDRPEDEHVQPDWFAKVKRLEPVFDGRVLYGYKEPRVIPDGTRCLVLREAEVKFIKRS